MNDKQQLAAMGEHIAEQAEQAAQPMCMEKRIEELEAQLAEKNIKIERLREMKRIAMKRVDRMLDRDLELSRLQSLMPEGWQLVPVKPTDHMTWVGQSMRYDSEISIGSIYRAMLAAAPSPDSAK